MAFRRGQADRLKWPLTPYQVEALDTMLDTLFRRLQDLETTVEALTTAASSTTVVTTGSASTVAASPGVLVRDGEDGEPGPPGPPGAMGPPGFTIRGIDGEDGDSYDSSFTGNSALSGRKQYFVSDTSAGAVTRKLTFSDGLLVSET